MNSCIRFLMGTKIIGDAQQGFRQKKSCEALLGKTKTLFQFSEACFRTLQRLILFHF